MLAPGALIAGRYRLQRLLGEGGMGSVWAAVNESFGRSVAVKVMLPQVAADPTAMERFQIEANICGTIRHPGIVDVLDVGRTEAGEPFLVMELLDGEPLDAILQRCGTLRPLDILPAIRDVARTLALAHERQVIHRDLKPGNIFLHRLPNGQVVAKVLDFGVARKEGGPTVTQYGVLVGSPAYMSPEQAAGRVEVDARSDVYGLGVMMYEALGGRLPFSAPTTQALMVDVAVKPAPPLSSVCTGLPKSVLDLVSDTMAYERDRRISSAHALADRIEATLTSLGASPSLPLPDPSSLGLAATGVRPLVRPLGASRAVVQRPRTSPRMVAVLAGGAVLVLGGAGIALKLKLQPAPATSPEPVVMAEAPGSSAMSSASVTGIASATVASATAASATAASATAASATVASATAASATAASATAASATAASATAKPWGTGASGLATKKAPWGKAKAKAQGNDWRGGYQ